MPKRVAFDRETAENLIGSARSEAYSAAGNGDLLLSLAAMLETTLGFDLERRTYYDNFALVQDDRHKKMAEIADLKATLATREAEMAEWHNQAVQCQENRAHVIVLFDKERKRLQSLAVEALDVIDSCPEHPDKNQHMNFIEDLRQQVEKFSR